MIRCEIQPWFLKTFVRCYYGRVNQKWKQATMLLNMLKDRDRRKNWEFNIINNNSIKSKNVFEKVHRPTRRQKILDSLFIENITDVLSTGDVAPEVIGSGIEITGVKLSPCCRILNVYWQVPPNKFTTYEEIAKMLCMRAPGIRAELISRNVMGKVPKIFFIRDITNAYLADFQEALAKVEKEVAEHPGIVDDSFTKDIFSFKNESEQETSKPAPKVYKEKKFSILEKPEDMRRDILGLNHDNLMSKILVAKKSKHLAQASALLESNDDLFDRIPGTSFQVDVEREKILKQFRIERKMLMEKKSMKKIDDEELYPDDAVQYVEQQNDYGIENDDYIEEETTDRFEK